MIGAGPTLLTLADQALPIASAPNFPKHQSQLQLHSTLHASHKKKVKRLSAWQHTVRDPVVNLPWRHKSQRLFIHLIPLFSDLKKLILFAGARHFINLMLVPAPFKGVDSNQTTTGLKSGAWTCLASWVTGQHETRTQHVLRERNAGIIGLSSCWQLRI